MDSEKCFGPTFGDKKKKTERKLSGWLESAKEETLLPGTGWEELSVVADQAAAEFLQRSRAPGLARQAANLVMGSFWTRSATDLGHYDPMSLVPPRAPPGVDVAAVCAGMKDAISTDAIPRAIEEAKKTSTFPRYN